MFPWRRWVDQFLVMNFASVCYCHFLKVSSPVMGCSQVSDCFVSLLLWSSLIFAFEFISFRWRLLLGKKELVLLKSTFFSSGRSSELLKGF